jgi:hypothetical protein
MSSRAQILRYGSLNAGMCSVNSLGDTFRPASSRATRNPASESRFAAQPPGRARTYDDCIIGNRKRIILKHSYAFAGEPLFGVLGCAVSQPLPCGKSPFQPNSLKPVSEL